MKKRKVWPMGTVSHGTMREEDLIPDFLWTLHGLAKRPRRADHLRLCREIQKRVDDDKGRSRDEVLYYGGDDAAADLESLFDALNEYAAPYFYFGAHPGDGSDYGFWLEECFEGDFEGLHVTDLADVPKDYEGEIMHVTDHGNVSLYTKARTQPPREIWAIV